MPACGQCGRENPEGTAFCGYCGYPLAKPAGKPSSSQLKPGVNPVSLPVTKPPPPPPAKMLRKPEVRQQTFATPPPSDEGKGKGGFEWIPWSELSPGQRAGRSVALVVAVLVILFMLRSMLRSVVGGGTAAIAPSAQNASALTDADRKDGIESLCKVFQIYGLPKNDKDAADAANNAAELYKLSGNQSPERSAYILNAVVADFRAGKLGQPDCAEAGYPLPTTQAAPEDAAPEANPSTGQQ